MKKPKGCGKLEIDCFVPVGSDARKKRGHARLKRKCGELREPPGAGIFLCSRCAVIHGLDW